MKTFLICPECFLPLYFVYLDGQNAVLSCRNNHEFPLVSGILFFHFRLGLNRNKMVNLIKRKQYRVLQLYTFGMRYSLVSYLTGHFPLVLIRYSIVIVGLLAVYPQAWRWIWYLASRHWGRTQACARKTIPWCNSMLPLCDIGCGIGNFLSYAQKFHYSCRIGVDISEQSLLLARLIFFQHRTDSPMLICADGSRNMQFFPSGFLGSITIHESIGYMENKLPCIRSSYRSLRNNGFLIMTSVHNTQLVIDNAHTLSVYDCWKLIRSTFHKSKYVLFGDEKWQEKGAVRKLWTQNVSQKIIDSPSYSVLVEKKSYSKK